MNKDPLVYLGHVKESIILIESYLDGKTKKDFQNDTELQDAVIRRLAIIGEAAKNLPEEFTKKNPEIPWGELARLRDKVVHGYFGIDLELVYTSVKEQLPSLKKQVNLLLEQ